ncbi:P1 family peptidase [Lutimaribacter sp. EGI FJ00015]|uniref:P1 family peptidase n=1 Tax=Lutimaribacter degradans TaxID=2945989 RepID=A0ACC5ZYE1_9RHOB|nr:P1 family peptidase [Lutimaribacter sp. EGI FJ00013]MCM2563393.1 P1 family peptidase [Lutimaribacter sp. EGI FJ00013]MCO0614528.1 P1 family peptidase [Lutimaribacter sp. EGI FJ00015]MCO0637201.1 P1 family peptidase [Lutimaribacter sp. EGI FJ00014]
MTTPRARDLGLPFPGTPGPLNAITDVAGIHVGCTTLTDPARAMRTGVTAIVPHADAAQPVPVRAGQFSLNGNGEMTGTHWIQDGGYFVGPVCITNTHGVGAVHDGVTRWMLRRHAGFYRDNHAWFMPVVAETYDGVLNDITAMHVRPDHAIDALNAAAPGPVAEGAVGGGNGMIAYEFKGGTGTSSRVLQVGGRDVTLGALVQANHGIRPWLNVLGQPVGRLMPEGALHGAEMGSIIVVLATDAPLSALSLRHLARRAALGIGRGGTPGGNNSGDIFLAFSVADPQPMPQLTGPEITRTEINPEYLDLLYLAAVEAVEEAVVNALVAAEDVPTVKPAGKVCRAIDKDALAALFR